MKYAVIKSGTVRNIAEAELALEPWDQDTLTGWVPHQAGIKRGDTYDGTSFTSVPVPATYFWALPPAVFKRRLEKAGRWGAFKTYFGTLTVAERMEWQWADAIEREGPLITALMAATGLTEAQRDALFLDRKAR